MSSHTLLEMINEMITIGTWEAVVAPEGPVRNSCDTSFHLLIDVATFLLAIRGATLRNVIAISSLV